MKSMKIGKLRFLDIAYICVFFLDFSDQFPARKSIVHKQWVTHISPY